MGSVEIESGKSFTTVIETKPFLVNKAGEYNLAIFINGEEQRLPFEIRIEAAEISLTLAALYAVSPGLCQS